MVALATLPDVTISIHAPREGRDHRAIGYVGIELISIHAPREGRDFPRLFSSSSISAFQSTRPARGATITKSVTSSILQDFNPRAPRGARREAAAGRSQLHAISIHAPREGRD